MNADAYTVGHDIVFAARRMAPQTQEGLRLIAHELAHVVQQSGADESRAGDATIRRQTVADKPAQPMPDMRRIYSFGPTGAGRYAMASSGTTIFSPAAPVDAKGNELVRAGTTVAPILSRFGRYFTLDERERPYPPPIPPCGVKVVTEWKPDDGSAASKDQKQDAAAQYYGPAKPLGTTLDERVTFPNDRPGVYTLVYIFSAPGDLFFLSHGVHFVNDLAAPPGAAVLDGTAKSQAAASPGAAAPAQMAGGAPEKMLKTSPPPQRPAASSAPPALVGRVDELTKLIAKAADATTKEPLVKELRGVLSRLQPFIPVKDAQKAIDDAIASLVNDGAKKLIEALLQTVTGKSPSVVPESRNQTGPNAPQKDLKEQIFHLPKIPFDVPPKPLPKLRFSYKNGPKKSYAAGAAMKFTVVPPDDFNSLSGSKRVVIVAEADRDKVGVDKFGDVLLESASPTVVVMTAPEKPGKYVIRVNTGLGYDYSSVEEFEVVAPEKK